MTWKSYATVSGATVVAGWLASSSPSNLPGTERPSARQAAAPIVAATDIQEQAERLRARPQVERTYTAPHRNPFRFADRMAVERPESAPGAGALESPGAPPVDVRPAAPRVSLSGIAEDATPSGPERTAILSSPAGVLMVREGEEFLGSYRVLRVESEAIELMLLADGTVRRLSLTNPKSQ